MNQTHYYIILCTIGIACSLSINLITNILATADGTQRTRMHRSLRMCWPRMCWPGCLGYTPQVWDRRSQHHKQLYFYLFCFLRNFHIDFCSCLICIPTSSTYGLLYMCECWAGCSDLCPAPELTLCSVPWVRVSPAHCLHELTTLSTTHLIIVFFLPTVNLPANQFLFEGLAQPFKSPEDKHFTIFAYYQMPRT